MEGGTTTGFGVGYQSQSRKEDSYFEGEEEECVTAPRAAHVSI
jgi:hypothetical protein